MGIGFDPCFLRIYLLFFAYIHRMSKYKDVVVTLSKKHPETSEPVQAGHTFVIGALGSKKSFYEIGTEQLNKLKDEDLQKELFKLLHPQTHH